MMEFLLLSSCLLLLPASGQPALAREAVTGQACDYVVLEKMGCPNGQKIVLKPVSGVTKKLMVLNNKVLIAFVTKGKLFSDCSDFSDITLVAAAACATIPGLDSVDLSVTMAADTDRLGVSKLYSDSKFDYYKVKVESGVTMLEGATVTTCQNAGMAAVCYGPSGCSKNDETQCMFSPLETSCGNTMSGMAQALCGTYAHQCAKLDGVFTYLAGQSGGDKGVLGGNFVWGKYHTSGDGDTWAYCVKATTTATTTVTQTTTATTTTAATTTLSNSGVRTSTSGVVTSQNHPAYYPNGVDKTYPIRAPSGHTVTITFTAFSLESSSRCRYDYVKITDGDGSTLMDKACGSTRPTTFETNSNRADVVFHSDGSVTRSGFRITWKSTGPTPTASTTVASTQATSTKEVSTTAATTTAASTTLASAIVSFTPATSTTAATITATSTTAASTTTATTTAASTTRASTTVASTPAISTTAASTTAATTTTASSTLPASTTFASTPATSTTAASTTTATTTAATTTPASITIASTPSTSTTKASTIAAAITPSSTTVASSSTPDTSTTTASTTAAITTAATTTAASTTAASTTLASTTAALTTATDSDSDSDTDTDTDSGTVASTSDSSFQANAVTANDCEYVVLSEVSCSNGEKFLVRPAPSVRKQLIFLNNKPLLAFVNEGKKFTACVAFLDITSKVQSSCRTFSNLENVELSGTEAAAGIRNNVLFLREI